MRARKPCLRARRRLFGWKVRLDTVDSLCGHEQPTARQKPPGEVAVPNVKRCVEIAVRLRSWSAVRVQRLRQLALDQAARCPAGAVLSDVRRCNRRKDGVKTTRICAPRPNQHAHFFPGAIGYPRNYNTVFFRRWGGKSSPHPARGLAVCGQLFDAAVYPQKPALAKFRQPKVGAGNNKAITTIAQPGDAQGCG